MSKTRSNLVISHMNQEERRHWASWIGMIAEGVAGVMAVNGGIPASRDVPDPGPARTRRPLTETEKRIIEHQGTEPPFSGEFVSFFDPGIYSCGAPLFRSEDKSDAGCGWPCFDDSLPDAVTSVHAGGGRRTEITCARCGGHLGHIFNGERLTPKNLRQFPFPGIPGSPSSDGGGCPPLKARGRKKYPAALPCAAGCGRRGGIYPEIRSRPRSLSRQQGISLTRKILAVSRIRLSAQPVSPVPGNRGD